MLTENKNPFGFSVPPDAKTYEFNGGIGSAAVQQQAANVFGENTVRLWNIAIKESERAMGHGTQMMTELLQHLKEQGIKTVYLTVRMGNNAAYRLYYKLGFRPSGRTAGSYVDGIIEEIASYSPQKTFSYLHELKLDL